MARIVVLGAGLAGTVAAFECQESLKAPHSVSVINNSPYYHFIPSAPWVAVGWRTPEQISVDLRPVFKKANIPFYTNGAKRVLPDENAVELNDGSKLKYDYLIIATGPELAFDELPGFSRAENFTVSICQTEHAKAAELRVRELIATPGPVVIGAVAGASCFGPAYEFLFILERLLRTKGVRDRVPMTFVTPEPFIGHLGLDGVGDTKTLLESEMRERHVKFITNAKVTKITSDKIFLDEIEPTTTTTTTGTTTGVGRETGKLEKIEEKVKQSFELQHKFSMLLPAFRGVEAVRNIPKLSNSRGFISVNEFQSNPSYPNIFAVGVCIAIPPMPNCTVPCGVPKTGFMIETMITAVVNNINSMTQGKQPQHKPTWNAACLADFGDRGVAFLAKPQIPPRNVNISSSGRWVHVAKIGFEKYFLYKVRKGLSLPWYEKFALKALRLNKIK